MSKIDDFINSLPPSPATFPSPKEILKLRLKNSADGYVESLDDNSPPLKAIEHEIEAAKANMSSIMSQLPLLATPITIPGAIASIKSLLPSTMKILNNLGVSPAPLDPVIEAMDKATKVLKTAGSTLVGPLSPLKDLLGL